MHLVQHVRSERAAVRKTFLASTHRSMFRRARCALIDRITMVPKVTMYLEPNMEKYVLGRVRGHETHKNKNQNDQKKESKKRRSDKQEDVEVAGNGTGVRSGGESKVASEFSTKMKILSTNSSYQRKNIW